MPWCGNAATRTSIIAIGNRLQHPKGDFPAWVSECEHDPLFWVSGVEGISIFRKTCGAVGFFMLAMALKCNNAGWLRVMSRWQIGPAAHLWLVQTSSHLASCLVKESLVAAVFLMLLLLWDLYACPQTLASASACLRSSALVRGLVFLCWCQVSFHSLAVKHLMADGKNLNKQQTVKIFQNRLLLWLLWCVLTLVFSTVGILYQVGQSIPGFLSVGKILSSALKAFVGSIQGLVVGFIVPSLARTVTREKHVLATVSNLTVNCFIPAVIIMYLDTACLGRWVAWWKPCQSNRQMFESRVICNAENQRDCRPLHLTEGWELNITVVRSSDLCDPNYSWSATSMSSCTHVLLLRLQEILLAKFVTTGVVMPGIALIKDKLPKESEAVLGSFAIHMAYAMVSSGHLPLMMPMLLLGFFAEGLVARAAWADGCCKVVQISDSHPPPPTFNTY